MPLVDFLAPVGRSPESTKTDARAGLTSGSLPHCGGRSRFSGGSPPPACSTAPIRSLVRRPCTPCRQGVQAFVERPAAGCDTAAGCMQERPATTGRSSRRKLDSGVAPLQTTRGIRPCSGLGNSHTVPRIWAAKRSQTAGRAGREREISLQINGGPQEGRTPDLRRPPLWPGRSCADNPPWRTR